MAKYVFTFTDDMDKRSMVIEASYRGSDMNSFIRRTVKNNRDKLNKFLSYIGTASFEMNESESNALINRGHYSCNAFSGRDELQFLSCR